MHFPGDSWIFRVTIYLRLSLGSAHTGSLVRKEVSPPPICPSPRASHGQASAPASSVSTPCPLGTGLRGDQPCGSFARGSIKSFSLRKNSVSQSPHGPFHLCPSNLRCSQSPPLRQASRRRREPTSCSEPACERTPCYPIRACQGRKGHCYKDALASTASSSATHLWVR